MRISNSKKQLARIINENGGWRDGAKFAAQDSVKDSCPCSICFYSNKPKLKTGARRWFDGNNGIVGGAEGCIHGVNAISNWHQTILSRDEYSHLYPAPDADVGSLSAALDLVTDENKHEHVDSKPTIEQLAADYSNRKDYADRKQQEADAAKADADAKLAELVAAGKALGLSLSVTTIEPEPELVITDWRDLQVGDEVEYVSGTLVGFSSEPGVVSSIDRSPDCGIYRIRVALQNGHSLWCNEWRFIRRPSKGETNA